MSQQNTVKLFGSLKSKESQSKNNLEIEGVAFRLAKSSKLEIVRVKKLMKIVVKEIK